MSRVLSTFPNPYRTATIRRSKSHLLIPDTYLALNRNVGDWVVSQTTSLTSDAAKCGVDRRTALKYGLAGSAAYGLMLTDPEKEAEAGIIAGILGAVFTAAIGWFVGRALDAFFPKDVTVWSSPPKSSWPTRDHQFHNSFADSRMVKKEDFYVPADYRRGYNTAVGFEECIRSVDQETSVVDQVRREATITKTVDDKEIVISNEEHYRGKPLVSIGYRRELEDSPREMKTLKAVAEEYDIDIQPEKVDYLQSFVDVDRKEYVGLAVPLAGKDSNRTGLKHQFLITKIT